MIRMRNEKNFDEKYARVMDDPKTEKFCFADQIEFILYAKRCKDEGKKPVSGTGAERHAGSNPALCTTCAFSSVGRTPHF